MYTIDGYGRMIADQERIAAYTEALRRHIRPESTVLDIGTGTGILACIACRLGARQVVAVEPDSVIHVARRIAAANGLADRIRFIQSPSTAVVLNRPADVVVSDLRGVLPPLGRNMAAIADARKRLMASGGVLIPGTDRIHLALVSDAALYDDMMAPWQRPGLDMRAAIDHITNMWSRKRLTPDALITSPALAAIIDYNTVSQPDLHACISWHMDRHAVSHGLAAWFDTDLVPGVGFSNAPDASPKLYAQAFFPFRHPLVLTPACEVMVTWSADLVGDTYHWRWKTHVTMPDRQETIMDQSTFYGAVLDPADLRCQSADHRPRLNRHGKIAQWAMARMDGTRTLAELAQSAAAAFPDALTSPSEAMVLIRTLALQVSRNPEIS